MAVLSAGSIAAGIIVPSMMRPTWSANRPSSDARLEILLPNPNEVVRGDTLEVDIRLVGAKLTSSTSTNLSPTSGHLHVSIDGRLLSMTTAVDTTVDISGFGDGEHLLQAEFVAADHGAFQPPVVASVPFEKRP